MQIMGIKSDAFYRNRLTHSLEVAQIARSIAALLQMSEDNLVSLQKARLTVSISLLVISLLKRRA